jgi:hypothetical protein
LIDLTVYREDFISQKRVDDLCKMLWDVAPGWVEDLCVVEDEEQSYSRFAHPTNWNVDTVLIHIREWFYRLGAKGVIDELSDLQMCDLVYELERRVRIGVGIDDFKPAGQRLAPTPEGPFPEHGDIIHHVLVGDIAYNIYAARSDTPNTYPPQYMVNYKALCVEHPEKLFTYGEEVRRAQPYGKCTIFVEEYLYKNVYSNNK